MKNFKKFFALVLMLTFVFQQCCIMPVLAVDIKGPGVQDVLPGSSYDIYKQFTSGTTDFRNYNQFELSKGQIANIIFSSQNGKFVNLMKDNPFMINGIVNSMYNGAFNNSGHVIFVSPQGTVVGASGVLNVGALSIFTPTKDKFTDFHNLYGNADTSTAQATIDTELGKLRTDSQGKIEVYGKIFSRGDVELHGSDIEIGNGTEKAGIFAGVQTSGTHVHPLGITAESQATALFNALVNNNLAQGAGFGLNNGKITVNAQAKGDKIAGANPVVASVDIDNALLGAKEIEIKAEAKAEYAFDDNDSSESSLGQRAPVIASVKIENSKISAGEINVSAEAKADYKFDSSYVNKYSAPDVISLFSPDNDTYYDTIIDEVDYLITNGNFSDDVYYGPTASATVSVVNSELNAAGNVKLTTNASADLGIKKSTVLNHSIDKFLYAYKTDTTSKINVNNSKIVAGGNVDIFASSENLMDVYISQVDTRFNQHSLTRVMLFLSKTESETEAVIDSDSTVNAKNLKMSAVNNTAQSVTASSEVKFKEKDSSPAAVSFTAMMNDTNINTKTSLEGTVVTSEDVTLNSQNLYVSAIYASASASGKEAADPEDTKDSAAVKKDGIISKLKDFYNKASQKGQGDDNNNNKEQLVVAGSGAVAYNNSVVNTTAQIGNTANITARNLTLNANTVDLTINQAIASSSNAKVGAGAAVIVNLQKDNTTAQIVDGNASNSAVIDIVGDLKLNATNNMPLNTDSLVVLYAIWEGLKAPFTGDFWTQIGNGNFDYLADYGKDWVDVKNTLTNCNWKQTVGLPGFFNNYAQSKGSGDAVGVAGSVIYSDVVNTTVAKIGNYTKVSGANNVIVNAANDIIYTNLAGVFDELYKPTSGMSGEFGVGGSIVLSFNEHNALAQVGENVEIGSGAKYANSLKLNAATDQTHINIAAGGGKAEKAAIVGSVAVVGIDGITGVAIGRNSKIFANSLDMNAGSAKAQPAERGSAAFWDSDSFWAIKGIDADGYIGLTERNITDTTRMYTIAGSLAMQEAEGSGGSKTSSGVAIGASVGVNLLEKTISAHIADGAQINYKKDLNLNASTDTQAVSVAIAGAFAGGVSADKSKNNTAGSGGNGDKQSTSNQGGWMDKITSILNKAKGVTESASTTDATNNALNNPTAGDNNTKNALGETGKDNISEEGSKKNENTMGDSLANSNNLTGNNNKNAQASDSTSNISVAAAGSVNATIMDNTASATVGNAAITKTGTEAGSMNITASQDTLLVDIAGGIGKAGTVGVGAALNLNMNNNETVAGSIGTLNLNGSDLKIEAKENQMAVDVAVGVGIADDQDANFQLAIGGSFNASVVDNKVNSYLGGKVEKARNIAVDAINKVQLIKVAGGASANKGGDSSTSIGMGLAGNLNILSKETVAEIKKNTDIEASGNVIVAANRKDGLTEPTGALDFKNAFKYADDMIISAAAAASIVTGGSNSFTLTGALGADIMNNVTQALVGSGASITSSTLRVEANDYVFNNNIAGAISFSAAESSVGVGVGAIVEVANNTTEAKIDSAALIKTTGNLDVVANYDEILNFLAVNGSVATGSGFIASVNGIVNVLLSTVNAEIANSQNIQSGNLNVRSNYDSTIEGVTAAVTLNVGEGFCASANIIANVLNNTVNANITNSKITSTGKITLSAISNEKIYLIPVAVAIATGSSAVAANIAATVLLNSTTASISGATTIAAGDIDVIAKDDTTQINRGGTVAVGAGTAAVGGSIIVDVYSKDVNAVIDDGVKITKANNVNVAAEAKNYFGPKDTVEIGGVNGLGKNTGATDVASLGNWEMVFDAAGGNSAAVSGSLITKVINNNVTAKVGKGVEISSKDLTVSALNDTVVRAIVGNFTASGTAAVGASLFVNVVTGTTQAFIDDGAKITSSGKVSIGATSIEDVRTIMIIGGGAGSVAVNGSANVNVFVNNTNATVGEGVTLNANSLDVNAKEEIDIQSINLVANGSGAAAIGAIAYVNTIINKVKAGIGNSEITTTNKASVKAESKEAFGGIFLIGNGSGSATVGGLAIVNVINSDVRAYIEEAEVTAGSLDVISIHNYNEWKYKSTSPIITGLNIGVSGAAAIAGTVVTNVIAANSSAIVNKSTIKTTSGLKIDASSSEKLFDVIASIAGSAYASVTGTAIVNVTDGEITAALTNSTVNEGKVDISAKETINILETIGSVAISGAASIGANAIVSILQSKTRAYSENTSYNIGTAGISINSEVRQDIIAAAAVISGGIAGISGTAVVNTVDNEVSAYILGGTITKAGNINVVAIQDTFISGDSAGLNAGAVAIGISGVVNVVSAQTSAYIDNTEIVDAGDIAVSATSSEDLFNINVNANIASGFAGGVNAIVNVIENETLAYINAKAKNVKANSITISASDTIDIENWVGTLGLDASFGGTAISAAVGVDVINNSVKAELLSTTGVYTVTNNVGVSAASDITLTPTIMSVAVGGVGIAGSVAVASIGGKYTNNGDTDYNSDGSVDKAQEQANRDKHSKTVNGKTYSTADVSLKTGTDKGGTVARIEAKEVNAKNVTVGANNTVDLTSATAALAGGPYVGLGANVLVNNMKYKTTAQIENSKINASGDVKVEANSDVEALTAAAAATIGGFVGISATVAYFKNSAITNAIISNTEISNARNVSVLANSTDDIDSKVLAVGAGLVGSSIVVGIAETDNKTRAVIDNTKITNTGNTDIIASTTSALSSDVATVAAGGVAINAVVNRSKSNALTEAIIKGASNINSLGNLRLISATGGISTAITMYMGSVSMYGVGVNASMADVSAVFNTKIEDTSIVEANNIDLKAGVNKTNYTDQGQLTSTVEAKRAALGGIVNAQVSYQRATVNGDTNITTGANTKVKARNILTVLSALNRTAKTGQDSIDIGGLTLGATSFESTAKGNSTIDLKGQSEASSTDVRINDTRTADARLNTIVGSVASIGATTVNADVYGNSNINVSNATATNSLNITNTSNKKSNIESTSYGISGLDIDVTNLSSTVSGASNITIKDCVANAINANLNDKAEAYSEMLSGSLSLIAGNINSIKSDVNTNTGVNLQGNIKANSTTVTTDIQRSATTTAQQKSGSLAGITVLNVDAATQGASRVDVAANMVDTNYKNALTVNSVATNTAKSFTGAVQAALIAISSGRIKNTMNTTNTVALSGANIDSSGDVNLKAENNNDMEMSRQAASYGGIIVSSDKIINDIDSKSYINISNAKINANNFTAEAKTKLKSLNPLKMAGDGYGFAVSSKTQLETTLKQSNEINITGGSKINARNNVNLKMAADTDFGQQVDTEAGGFTALKSGAKSFLTVTNNNTLNVTGSGTEVNAGNNLNVALDSSNTLESKANTSAKSFASDPGVKSTINLTINNTINTGDTSQSNSLMSAGNLVKIDFLKNSRNVLNQDAYLYAEAAIATGSCDGGIDYKTNNSLNVKKGAKILSMKDVLINYSSGINTLNSRVAYKKVSRILLGIPITTTGSTPSVTTAYSNSLTLDGTIEAGTGNERVFVIDKDGNVATDKIKGFKSTDYQVIESGTSDIDLQEGSLEAIDKEIKYLEERIAALRQDDSNNADEIAKYNAELGELNNIIGALKGKETINLADASSGLYNALNDATRNSASNNGVRNEDLDQITSRINNSDGRNSILWYLQIYSYTTGSGNNQQTVKLTGAQINNIMAAYDSAYNANMSTLTIGSDTVTLFKGKIIIENANDSMISDLLSQATASRDSLLLVVDSMNSDSTAEITKLEGEITALKDYKTSLVTASLTGEEAGTGGTVLFKDINAHPSKIEITGLGKLTGSGEFLIHGNGLLIDNYSQKSLVFGNINFANVGNAGLTINGHSYNSKANTGVGIPFPRYDIFNNDGPLTGVRYNKTADTGITINNWYDHNNPLLVNPHIAKITVMGNILNPSGLVDIFNDSGNITLNGTLNANEKRIVAAQGDVVMKKIGTLALAANDYIIAGRNVLITGNVTNAGLIQAGVPDRNLVIDDAMYTDKLEVDANGVLKMDKKYKSVYLNDTNNVKAIKDGSGNIQLYNTIVDGGTVNISGTATNTGAGSIKASTVSGYGSINVTNNTNHDLIVNNVTNNYIINNNKTTGATINPTDLYSSATTNINSAKGNMIVSGLITSGNNGTLNTGTGTLNLIAQEGSITIADRGLNDTIDATGAVDIQAKNGVNVLGKIKNRKGDIKITNTDANDILVDTTGRITNNEGNIMLTNAGTGGITVKGEIANLKGSTTLTNSGLNGILIESTGRITNDNGNMTLKNDTVNKSNMTIRGLILAKIGNIKLLANNSNIIIGDKTTNDNYIETRATNSVVDIEINNGSLLNANRNESTDIINGNPLNTNASALDKTLIKAGGDLKIAVVDGDIGSYDQTKGNGARNNLPPGFTIYGTTRDYTETINVKVAGNITASAKNSNGSSGGRLINLRSKQSDMNINKIEADGNVMLTAADWKQKDSNPTPGSVDDANNPYFIGYSILNDTNNSENIVGDNISLISSNNLGSATSKLTYRNTNGGWLSAEAENNIFLKGAAGFDSNIWQLISKRGDIEFILNGDAVIREIAAGRHIYLQSLGANLTILSLGIADGSWSFDDDLLYPHDLIKLGENGGGIPETVAIEVLDAYGGNSAYSTLNIFSAYLKGANPLDTRPRKGQDGTKSDVTLMADKIIATSASAPSSNIHTNKYSAGYENSGRYYAIDPINATIDFDPDMSDPNKVAAEGFTTYGAGPQLSFSIGGVNPDVVAAADAAKPVTRTNFKEFVPIQTIKFFNNILQMPFGKDYKADEVRLSINSNNRTNENRGTLLNRLYADNAYVDTMDLNLTLNDAQITNYAEFRNGNRGGAGGYSGPYRWLSVIDNDFRRYIDAVSGKTVTVQYFTEKTGSLSINMGNLIDVISPAPAVHYNPYEVSNMPQSENSFFRLTYKDDKIQKTTTTPEFEEVDKSTYKPTKREGIRFSVHGTADGIVLVSDTEGDGKAEGNDEEIKKKLANIIRILEIVDISRGGLKVSYSGELKIGDTFKMVLSVGDINADVNVKVVRLDGSSKAGLKFVDLDRATANKILYMNMFVHKEASGDTPTPQAQKPAVSEKLLGLLNR